MLTISRSTLLCWFFALLNPLFGLTSATVLLLRRKNGWVLPFSLSLALVYSYLPTPWDVKNNFDRIVLRPEDGLNLYTSFLYVLKDFFGISYYGAIFITTFITLYLIGTSVDRLLRDRMVFLSKKNYIFLFFLIICLFEYRAILDLQKTTLAFSIFVFAVGFSSISIRYALFFLAVWVHPISLLLILCYLIAGFHFSSRFLFLWIFIAAGIGFGGASAVVDFALSNQAVVSERVVNYLLIEKSRYSSDSVAMLVRGLRVFSVLSIMYAAYYMIFQFYHSDQSSRIARAIYLIGGASVALSFNEIMLERTYMAVSFLFIISVVGSKCINSRIVFAGCTILMNTMVHGTYTMNVLFSSGYDVISNHNMKISIALSVFYMPTPFLLNFDLFGYSNSILLAS